MLLSPQGLKRVEAVRSLDFLPLHDGMNGRNLTILVQSWLALLLDSPVDLDKPLCLIYKLYGQFITDYRGTVRRLAELGDLLANSVTRSDDGVDIRSLHHEFRRTPVFREYQRWYETSDPGVLSFLFTFLWFGKKTEFVDPNFETRAFQAWCEVEYEMEKHTIPQHMLDDLWAVVQGSGFRVFYDDFAFRHGPGYVSEESCKRSYFKKTAGIRYSEKVDSSILAAARSETSYPRISVLLPDEDLWEKGRLSEADRSIEHSRLSFVPKDYKTVRSICMEPTTYMWAQQGLANAFVRGINRSVFSKVIHIRDQSYNRIAARKASRDGDFATLDLSSASDRLHNDIVKSVFDPELVSFLQGTRTSVVLTPLGKMVDVNKFAPMGSALCFPVQSVVFTAVLMLCDYLKRNQIPVSNYLEREVAVFSGVPSCEDGCCVFGDDIVCPNCQADDMISLLTAMGFSVNSKKSFYGTRLFRESCGGYFLGGAEIVILLLKVKGMINADPCMYQGLIDLINRLYDRGYDHAREVLLAFLPRDNYIYCNPDDDISDESRFPGRVKEHSDNARTKWRFHKDYQRIEYRLRVASTAVETLPAGYFPQPRWQAYEVYDRYEYNSWLQSPILTEWEDKPPVGDVGQTTLRWIWTPA